MLNIITTNTLTSGVALDLGTDDSARIAEGVFQQSTGTDVPTGHAIIATGSNQSVELFGYALAKASDAILMGLNTADSHDNVVRVSTTGLVSSDGGSGIGVQGYSDLVDNAGHVEGATNGISYWSTAGVPSEHRGYVLNSGFVKGVNDGVYVEATEMVVIRNSGTIVGGDYSIAAVGSGVVRVVNTGVLKGVVALGSGNDVYDGRDGFAHNNIQGFSGNDRLLGGQGDEVFYGGAGNDTISGGDGNDYISGGIGADKLTGGADADVFQFLSIAESGIKTANRDLITDFSQSAGDTIDLSAIDAKGGGADNAFKFIGTDAFSKAGELRYEIHGNTTTVFLNTDNDNDPEASIVLHGKIHLVAGDFVL